MSNFGSVKITDGTDDATVRDVTAAKALDVSIVDGSGNQITSFGGGTQYTEGDADATITGTAALMEVAADTLQPVQGTVADGLLVNLGSNNDVSGTVTANLGTIADVATQTTLSTVAGDTTSLDAKILASMIDTNNTTATPLGGDAVYTGTATDVIGYASIAVLVVADVDSTTDGMQFQFCPDSSFAAANTDSYNFTLDASDSNQRRFQFPVTARYFRVVYTNESGAQSNFDVQTILHRHNILTSIHRVGNALTTDRSAQLVKAVVAGETTAGGGAMVNVKVNPSGTLEVNANQGDDPWNCDITANSIGLATEATLGTIDTDTGNIATSVGIMDDWDETNRAAVNLIASQVGVAGNAGVIGATTQRVIQALDTGWLTLRANYTTAQTNAVFLAGAGGETIHVKQIDIMADNANTVDVQARVGFDATTTPTGADVIATHPGIAPGSGISKYFGEAGIASQTTGDDILITSEVPTGGSIDVFVVYRITS